MSVDRRPAADVPPIFAVECPGCRAHVAVAGRLAGRAAGCPRCRAAFIVPVPGQEERRPPRPEADGRRAAADVEAPEPRAAERPERPRAAPVLVEPPRPEPPRTAPVPAEPAMSLVFSEPPVPSTRRRHGPSAGAATTTVVPAPAMAETVSTPPEHAAVADAIGSAATLAGTAPPAMAGVPGGLAFREPVRTVRSGGAEIELRRLTPDEKRARRARRNLIIFMIGAALLLALVVILGKVGR